MKLIFLGHAAVQIKLAGTEVLIDPFLTGNPQASAKAEEVSPDFILLSHGHADHVGDTVAIAKRTGATVIAPFELGEWIEAQGAKAVPMNHGGECSFPFGRVKLTIAFHSSSVAEEQGRPLYLGEPAGLLLQAEGKTIYHAGDTALFSDMQLIRGDGEIDLAFLPVGDHFTMGPKDAAKAVEFLRPRNVVPMHYGTFPPLVGDPAEFKRLVRDAKVHLLAPGESIEL